MRTLLSIDWDYFIPEKAEWDLGHAETEFLIKDIWSLRCFGSNILEEMTTNGEEIGFWKKARSIFNIAPQTPMAVTESHGYGYILAEIYDIDKVINIDSHSDLGYHGLKSLATEEVGCDNWIGKLLSNDLIKKANLIYSLHTLEKRSQFSEIIEEYHPLIFRSLKEFHRGSGRPTIDFVHVARSGTWTPPWLDEKFNTFVKQAELPIIRNSVIEREFNLKEMQEQMNEFRKNQKLLDEVHLVGQGTGKMTEKMTELFKNQNVKLNPNGYKILAQQIKEAADHEKG